MKIHRLSVTFNDRKVDFTAPFPRLARVKHRYEMDGKSILEWNGWKLMVDSPEYPIAQQEIDAKTHNPPQPISVPSVVKGVVLGQDGHCTMPCAWQKFHLQVIAKHVRSQMPGASPDTLYNKAIQVWTSGMRSNGFLTNKTGTNDRNNCITRPFPDREMLSVEPIFTGGNTILLLEDRRRITGGHDAYPVRCFSSTATPPLIQDVNIYNDPRILWLTLETRIFVAPDKREIRQGGQAGIYRFPYFILGENSDVVWIPFDRVA